MTYLRMLLVCTNCGKPILDKYVLTVLEKPWHPSCVRCADCNNPLNEKCFARDGKIYCREDFYRRFGPKCGGCGLGIPPMDLVRKARDKVFHLKCFVCHVCRKQLLTGEELYVIDDSKFVCKDDYTHKNIPDFCYEDEEDLDEDMDEGCYMESSAASGLSSGLGANATLMETGCAGGQGGLGAGETNNNNGTSLGGAGLTQLHLSRDKGPVTPTSMGGTIHHHTGLDSSTERDPNDSEGSVNGDVDEDGRYKSEDGSGGSKRRGPRTTIKAKQLEILKTAFNQTPKPTRHIREQLAKETGLPMRVIQVWFQNKRSKERRMKQLSGRGAGFFVAGKRLRGFGLGPPGLDDVRYGYYGDAGGPEFPNYPARFPSDFFPGGCPPSMEQPLPMTIPPIVGSSDYPHPSGLQPSEYGPPPPHMLGLNSLPPIPPPPVTSSSVDYPPLAAVGGPHLGGQPPPPTSGGFDPGAVGHQPASMGDLGGGEEPPNAKLAGKDVDDGGHGAPNGVGALGGPLNPNGAQLPPNANIPMNTGSDGGFVSQPSDEGIGVW